MFGWLVRKKLDAYEREFDYDTSYLRDIYAASPRAFWRFSKFVGLSTYREGAPYDAWFAAKLVGTLAEDCGPCTQLVVTMAERAGLNAAVRFSRAMKWRCLPMPRSVTAFRAQCFRVTSPSATCSAKKSFRVGDRKR